MGLAFYANRPDLDADATPRRFRVAARMSPDPFPLRKREVAFWFVVGLIGLAAGIPLFLQAVVAAGQAYESWIAK
jgi:hypothetical protein